MVYANFQTAFVCKQDLCQLFVGEFFLDFGVYFPFKMRKKIKEDGLWLISPKVGSNILCVYVCVCV